MFIKGDTNIFGVVGNPISHSFSPGLHNFLFEKLNMNNVYIPIEVNKENFIEFINGVKNIGNLIGLNITVPFKNVALKVCDEISDEAVIIGSVNTLLFKNKKIYGYNTDSFGFIKSLNINFSNIKLKDSVVVVLGAGGASRAVLYSLIKEGVKKIILVNRTVSKAEELKNYFMEKMQFNNIVVKQLPTSISEEADIVINTTSVGLKADDDLLIDLPINNNIKLVYDLIYNPPMTKLLNSAKSKGINFINGKDMLILQAFKSFEIWMDENVLSFLDEVKKFL